MESTNPIIISGQIAYSFGFNTATAPLGSAYEPSGVVINIDFGIPVGGFTLLTS